MNPVTAEIVASARDAFGLGRGVKPYIVCRKNRRPHAMTTISSVSSLITSLGEIPPETVIFGHSETMQSLRERMDKVASANVPVLIQGESGTGKDIIARMIHARSPWRTGPFVQVNCPAIPGTLLESELFGYEKGAFTGAYGSKRSEE